MASIPQEQISNAYYYCLSKPLREYGFGRGYVMWYDGNHVYKLWHYGTLIYVGNSSTKKMKVAGWSTSDVMAINSVSYYVGTPRVYMTEGRIYAEGEGPRYKKKKKDGQMHPFGL